MNGSRKNARISIGNGLIVLIDGRTQDRETGIETSKEFDRIARKDRV